MRHRPRLSQREHPASGVIQPLIHKILRIPASLVSPNGRRRPKFFVKNLPCAKQDAATLLYLVGFILDDMGAEAHTDSAMVPHMVQSTGDQTGMWTGRSCTGGPKPQPPPRLYVESVVPKATGKPGRRRTAVNHKPGDRPLRCETSPSGVTGEGV